MAAAVGMLAAAGTASAQTDGARPAAGTAFSAEVTVTHAIVDRSGRTTRELPSSRYRLERGGDGRLHMTMLATRAQPARGPLADPYAGITVDTDDSGQWRMRDASGRTMAVPAADGAQPAPVADADGLLVAASDRVARLDRLAQRFGPPAGTVRSLRRYLARSGRVVEEVLVAADTGLAAEINRTEDGRLVEHHRFEYAALPGGQFVRSRTRSESAMPGGDGARFVSLTTLRDIRVDGGAR